MHRVSLCQAAENSDRQHDLLRVRGERPTCGYAANERDQVPSPHRMTFQREDKNLSYQTERRVLRVAAKCDARLPFRVDVRFTPKSGHSSAPALRQ